MAPCPSLPHQARRCDPGRPEPSSEASARQASLVLSPRPGSEAAAAGAACCREGCGGSAGPCSAACELKDPLKTPAASSHSCGFKLVTEGLPCTPEGKVGGERAGGETGTMKRVSRTASVALAWGPDRRASSGSGSGSISQEPCRGSVHVSWKAGPGRPPLLLALGPPSWCGRAGVGFLRASKAAPPGASGFEAPGAVATPRMCWPRPPPRTHRRVLRCRPDLPRGPGGEASRCDADGSALLTCDPGVLDRRPLENTCASGTGAPQRVGSCWQLLTYGAEGATVVPLHASPQGGTLRQHHGTAAFRPSRACPAFSKEAAEVTSRQLCVLVSEEKAKGRSLPAGLPSLASKM